MQEKAFLNGRIISAPTRDVEDAVPYNGTPRAAFPTFFVTIIIEQINVNFNENSNCIYVLFSFLQLISLLLCGIIKAKR